jgi:hypothetical protein
MGEKSFKIEQNMAVVGHDGFPVGTVDCIDGDRIRLKNADRFDDGAARHPYVEIKDVSGVEGNTVRLFANAGVAVYLEEEESGRPSEL